MIRHAPERPERHHHQSPYLHPMRYEHHRLVPERAADALVEDVLADLGVHGAQGVVQEVDVGVGVHGARQVHTLLLAAAGGENGEVGTDLGTNQGWWREHRIVGDAIIY